MEKHVARAAPTRGRLRAAWTLILLAPLCAELAFSAVGMPIMWVAFPFLIPMYGLGVLVVRDLVARAGGGWASLLVMGLVYELAEDGLGLQALTSPNLYNAAEWGPRVFGFNLTYWEAQVGYHAVFSVLIPVVLTDLIFPAHRGRPYLRNGGLIGAAIAAVLGIAMLKVVFTSTTDPGYFAPIPFLGGVIVVMFALSFVALRILPGRFPGRPPTLKRSIPRPVVAGAIGGVATVAYLALLMPMTDPPDSPAIGRGAFVLIPMTVAAIIGIGMVVLIGRWNASTRMTDMHRIWLAGGSLVGHTLFVIIAAVLYPADAFTVTLALTTGPLVIAITVVLLTWLGKRVQARKPKPSPVPSVAP